MELVIFDLWNTLAVMSGPSVTSALMNTFNLNIEKEKVRKIYEINYQTKRVDSIENTAMQMCCDLGIKHTVRNRLKIIEILKSSIGDIRLYPHTIPMLKKLRQNYKIGIISNTSAHPILRLKAETELFKYIDYAVFSFNTGFLKPQSEIFDLMLKKANCKPEEAIMIGDGMIKDVLPAKKAGLRAVQFQNYQQLKNDLEKKNIDLT